jgi:hypothetical protein
METIFKQQNDTEAVAEDSTIAEDEKIILCAACFHHITDPGKQVQVNQSFTHIFSNPHGIVFEIGCFAEAPGCYPASPFYSEFSWFIGYSWSIAACSNCSDHLGWVFSSQSDGFWGLILDKLIFT